MKSFQEVEESTAVISSLNECVQGVASWLQDHGHIIGMNSTQADRIESYAGMADAFHQELIADNNAMLKNMKSSHSMDM